MTREGHSALRFDHDQLVRQDARRNRQTDPSRRLVGPRHLTGADHRPPVPTLRSTSSSVRDMLHMFDRSELAPFDLAAATEHSESS